MSGTPFQLSAPSDRGRHRIHIERSPKRVRGEFGGVVVADSLVPLLVLESTYLPVYYFPFSDIRTDYLVESPHRTVCPYKGEARYWHLQVGDRRAENALWAYLNPVESAGELGGHGAFYWDTIDRWLEEDERALRRCGSKRVYDARGELFSGAALTSEQHGRVACDCNPSDLPKDGNPLRASANELLAHHGSCDEVIDQAPVF